MSSIAVKTILRETLKTLRHPSRVRRLINTDLLVQHLQRESLRDVVKDRWAVEGEGAGLRRREYRSYEDYIAHQRDKLTRLSDAKMRRYDEEFRAALKERLQASGIIEPGMSVLCLAARIGTEVRAFTDLGCFAVGIDLNPGEANPYVLPGDFHQLQFADACVDAVFTNSLDHAFDFDRLISEIVRVLKPGGRLIVEAARGSEEGLKPGFYESFWWSRVDDLIDALAVRGFELQSRSAFTFPWVGEHLCFLCRGSDAAESDEAMVAEVACG